jgi:hypothetical protein
MSLAHACGVGGVSRHVNVVVHQAIRVQRTCRRADKLGQRGEIHHAIGVIAEAGVAVMAPLDDMKRDIGNDIARLSRHKREQRPASSRVD